MASSVVKGLMYVDSISKLKLQVRPAILLYQIPVYRRYVYICNEASLCFCRPHFTSVADEGWYWPQYVLHMRILLYIHLLTYHTLEICALILHCRPSCCLSSSLCQGFVPRGRTDCCQGERSRHWGHI